jgi:uncharacterized membrane protein
MAESVMPASSQKDLTLEIVQPYSVSSVDYNFTAMPTLDGVKINKSLMLTLKGGVGMAVSSQKIAYDARPGEAFDIGI